MLQREDNTILSPDTLRYQRKLAYNCLIFIGSEESLRFMGLFCTEDEEMPKVVRWRSCKVVHVELFKE